MATHAARVATFFARPDPLVPLCVGDLSFGKRSIGGGRILAAVCRTHLLQVSLVLRAVALAHGWHSLVA